MAALYSPTCTYGKEAIDIGGLFTRQVSKMILNYVYYKHVQIYLQHQQCDHQQNHTKHRSFAAVIWVILLGHLPTTFPTAPAAAETQANNRH